LRYWDGAQWTSWVTDDQQPFQEGLPKDAVARDRRTAVRIADRDLRFFAHVMILVATVALPVGGAIALFFLTQGATQPGAFLGIAWLALATRTLRRPYVAILRPDGSLTFKALTRTITSTADSVYRITVGSGRGRSYVFYFDDRKASLEDFGGQALCRYLRERNPTIEGP
jgi:hypothetical protein